MKNKFETREEAILNSVDEIQPADVPPFFYTRLVARMDNELAAEKKPVFFLKPVFLTASLSVVLMINIIFLFQLKTQKQGSGVQPNNEASMQSFADAYGLNTSPVYE